MIVATYQVDKGRDQALNCDDGIFLSYRLLETKVRLQERRRSILDDIGCERGRDPKELC